MTIVEEDEIYGEQWGRHLEAVRLKDIASKRDYKKQLKGLINISGLYRTLDEGLDNWLPVGIVEVIPTDEKMRGYASYDCGRIKGEEGYLYLKQSIQDIRGIKHSYVWQISDGCSGDSYMGFSLYPLKDGKYLKISYSC